MCPREGLEEWLRVREVTEAGRFASIGQLTVIEGKSICAQCFDQSKSLGELWCRRCITSEQSFTSAIFSMPQPCQSWHCCKKAFLSTVPHHQLLNSWITDTACTNLSSMTLLKSTMSGTLLIAMATAWASPLSIETLYTPPIWHPIFTLDRASPLLSSALPFSSPSSSSVCHISYRVQHPASTLRIQILRFRRMGGGEGGGVQRLQLKTNPARKDEIRCLYTYQKRRRLWWGRRHMNVLFQSLLGSLGGFWAFRGKTAGESSLGRK